MVTTQRWGMTAAAVACVAGVIAPAGAQRLLTENDEGRVIRLRVGDEVDVRLRQQAGTPYQWELRRDPHVTLSAPTATLGYGDGVGGRQDRQFRVRVIAPGRFALVFGLRSRVEGAEQPVARRVLFNIDTGDGGSDDTYEEDDVRPAPRPYPAPTPYRPGPSVVGFTEADDGRTVQLPVGAEITVRLRQQAGTPYNWELKDDYRIRQIGEPRTQDMAREGLVGGPQLRVFRIQVTSGGRIPLDFRLRSRVDKNDAGRVRITIESDSDRYVPGTPDNARPAQVIGEREAGGIVSTRQGQPIEIHLDADKTPGYTWEVLDSRNLAFDGPVGVEYKPGIFGLGRGNQTNIRLRTTVIQSDGFLTLVLMRRGERADRFRAAKVLSYQFHNQR